MPLPSSIPVTPRRSRAPWPAATAVLAERWLAYLYLAAGVLGIFNALLPGYPNYDTAALLVLSTAVLGVGTALWRTRGRLPRSAVHVLLALGTAGIGAAISFTQGVPNAASMLYLWVALYAFYFFPRSAAAVHVAILGASYAVAIALRPPPFSPFPHWATTVATMAIAGAFVGHLKGKLDATLARASHLAVTDELTGLANRRGWLQRADVELARATRTGQPPAMLLVDLDNFKAFNDRFGHGAGDGLLSECAAAWQELLRDIDVLTRLGGDEFAILLAGCDEAAALAVAQRLRAATPDLVGCSIGVALWRAGELIDDITRRADGALYEAKRSGTGLTVADGAPAMLA